MGSRAAPLDAAASAAAAIAWRATNRRSANMLDMHPARRRGATEITGYMAAAEPGRGASALGHDPALRVNAARALFPRPPLHAVMALPRMGWEHLAAIVSTNAVVESQPGPATFGARLTVGADAASLPHANQCMT